MEAPGLVERLRWIRLEWAVSSSQHRRSHPAWKRLRGAGSQVFVGPRDRIRDRGSCPDTRCPRIRFRSTGPETRTYPYRRSLNAVSWNGLGGDDVILWNRSRPERVGSAMGPAAMNADPDFDLVMRCQESSLDALEGAAFDLYEAYKDRVYNICYRITGFRSDALDASQETFGIVYRKLKEFRFESRFSSWVYRIAVNASIDLKRRASTRRLVSLDSIRDNGTVESVGFDVEDEHGERPTESATRHELEDEIQAAISRLSPKLSGITALRYSEGLSYEQISEVLQIAIGTVKSRLARAHDALERELTPVLDRHGLGGLS